MNRHKIVDYKDYSTTYHCDLPLIMIQFTIYFVSFSAEAIGNFSS